MADGHRLREAAKGPTVVQLRSGGGLVAGALAFVEVLMRPEPTPDLVDLLALRPPWMAQAACRGRGPSLFFPSRGEPNDEVRELCARCPAREPCLAFAVAENLEGVWAGTSKRERRAMRRLGGA